MTRMALIDIVKLGAITGMRSMAGPAAVSLRSGGAIARVVAALAAGEMVADKTPGVGNRVDPFPLTGRAVMGAVVGGKVARDRGVSAVAGALIGAMTAVVAAHVAYRIRARAPVSAVAGGLIEDAIVLGLASVRTG